MKKLLLMTCILGMTQVTLAQVNATCVGNDERIIQLKRQGFEVTDADVKMKVTGDSKALSLESRALGLGSATIVRSAEGFLYAGRANCNQKLGNGGITEMYCGDAQASIKLALDDKGSALAKSTKSVSNAKFNLRMKTFTTSRNAVNFIFNCVTN